MHGTIKQWLGMNRAELDAIYRNAQPGQIPRGDTRGTAIVAGSLFAKPLAWLARLLFWQGKVFEHDKGILVNKITPFGWKFVTAKVYHDKSWLDGNDTIVIDYSKTSFMARKIRDEIREVEPGVYLGKVWWGKTRILDFALNDQPDQA